MPRRHLTKEMYDNNGKRDNSAVFIGKVIVVVKYIAIVYISYYKSVIRLQSCNKNAISKSVTEICYVFCASHAYILFLTVRITKYLNKVNNYSDKVSFYFREEADTNIFSSTVEILQKIFSFYYTD